MKNEKGFILVAGLLVILLLTVMMIGAMNMAIGNIMATGNDREGRKAFYLAEAGVEEAKGRIHPASPNNIPDTNMTSPSWSAFIGDPAKAPLSATKYTALTALPYDVTITHKTNSAGQVIKWGDTNQDGVAEQNLVAGYPIYVIDSTSHPTSGAQKRVRIEASRIPELSSIAALYTKEPTTIMGSSTYINGKDSCGGSSVPGVLTMNAVTLPGKATLDGNPAIFDNSPTDLRIPDIIQQMNSLITQTIAVGNSNPTLTGVSWGNPTPGATTQQPSSCSDTYTRVTFVDGSVKLAGGSKGCGVLMVSGNLEINGGFQWYGIILVAGSLKFSGGGERNITGSVLAGGAGAVDVVGGDTAIVYCSSAINLQTDRVPLLVLKWEEVWG